MKNIFEFWNENNQSTAFSEKLYHSLNNKLELAIQHPFIGTKTIRQDVYVLVVLKFLVYYKVREQDILVMHIRDGRRKLYITKS